MPVTILDVILVPASLILGPLIIKNILFEAQEESLTEVSSLQLIGLSLFSIFILIPLSLFILLDGIEHPFGLMDSVKGRVHGYTEIVMGLVMLPLSVAVSYRLIVKLLSNRK